MNNQEELPEETTHRATELSPHNTNHGLWEMQSTYEMTKINNDF